MANGVKTHNKSIWHRATKGWGYTFHGLRKTAAVKLAEGRVHRETNRLSDRPRDPRHVAIIHQGRQSKATRQAGDESMG